MIEIKHKDTGEVLHTVQGDTLLGVNLSGADLRCADLIGADLSNAYLYGAYLYNADLQFLHDNRYFWNEDSGGLTEEGQGEVAGMKTKARNGFYYRD